MWARAPAQVSPPRMPPHERSARAHSKPYYDGSMSGEISATRVASTYTLIRPDIRRTPLLEVDEADFGLDGITLVFKLESLQHSGSFKARGAFTNLLMRHIPSAGVVAASGGNHGTAVAFAAMKLKKPARIFVPEVASPTKLERIREYGADLVGDRRAICQCAGRERAMGCAIRRADRACLRSG